MNNFYLLKFFFAVLILVGVLNCGKKEKNPETENQKSGEYKNTDTLTAYEKGLKYYKENEEDLSLQWFQQIDKSDSNYNSAQNYIKELKKSLIAEEKRLEQKDKERTEIIAKYKKLCKSGLYQYEIEQRLGNDDFYQVSSDFEKAPDGSTGVKQVYSKRFDDFTVYVSLQNAYALGSYYCDVWTE